MIHAPSPNRRSDHSLGIRLREAWALSRLGLCLGPLITGLVAGTPTLRPLAGHPGNVFLADETVAVSVPGPGAWSLVNEAGRVWRTNLAGPGSVTLGTLPVGWYELRRDGAPWAGSNRVALAVLAPRASRRTDRAGAASPIGLDVAMAWFYPAERMPAAANLCALAGVHWVRDRLNWREIEPARGHLADPSSTRYDSSAVAQHEAGLRVLQVIHLSPAWANPETKRFPLDLRDAHAFYRAMAARWRDRVQAFEPWNEADIDVFGGHTGSEIASLQKAAYLGLKAGNPDIVACQNVFALHQPAILGEFAANEPEASFDTMNLHHYVRFDQYPEVYAAFRAIAGGKPLWTTECSLPVKWAGEARDQEPTAADLGVQAERVAKTFACALHEGAAKVFYFLLPHYVEGQTQFGLLRADLTPRPAYVALAAVGRFLADAQPRGRLQGASAAVRAYLFRARPDGRERDVLVAWSTNGVADLDLPCAPEAAYDHLGRPIGAQRYRIELESAPKFVVLPNRILPVNAHPWTFSPPPAKSRPSSARTAPVVLQAIWPTARIDLKASAYRIGAGQVAVIPIKAYNFGSAPERLGLRLTHPDGWQASVPAELVLPAGQDAAFELRVTAPQTAAGKPAGRVRIEADLANGKRAVLALNLEPESPSATPTR
jgi:hypothetical protein